MEVVLCRVLMQHDVFLEPICNYNFSRVVHILVEMLVIFRRVDIENNLLAVTFRIRTRQKGPVLVQCAFEPPWCQLVDTSAKACLRLNRVNASFNHDTSDFDFYPIFMMQRQNIDAGFSVLVTRFKLLLYVSFSFSSIRMFHNVKRGVSLQSYFFLQINAAINKWFSYI